MKAEQIRLSEHYSGKKTWLKWGPYLSERQWGTVREDYSPSGDSWNFITHDMARSKAYRWGEEGLAGISDDKQTLCVALALWNGKDPILKERLFGLTNNEGNHGEDVKELYYYLDSTPTHSYLKMLYKYPQAEYPYEKLLKQNKSRGKNEAEYELIDTGIFDENRYFDVFTEYVKNDEEDILIQYTIHNRANEDAPIHVLPNFWFRDMVDQNIEKPLISQIDNSTLLLTSAILGEYYCYYEDDPEALFTNNISNNQRLYSYANESEFVKDGINERVVHNNLSAVNSLKEGTKAAVWYSKTVAGNSSITLRLRLCKAVQKAPFKQFDSIFNKQIKEANEFYDAIILTQNEDEKLVKRQAYAGLLWSKQFYAYHVNTWLKGDNGHTPPEQRLKGRNHTWKHFIANHIISMPDKWEYPWFAAWDLAFHCISFSEIDPDFAKNQLRLLVGTDYIHPNGQLPAYEWDFNDVNPPVHALATWLVYQAEKKNKGQGDLIFMEEVFQKLLLNFTWWVNRKDSEGNNIFEGGFLGLDNIGIFNRSAAVPGGGFLEQADGTSWMAMYSLNMMQISMELALQNPVYENMAIKFADHFLYIAGSMAQMGDNSFGLWDDEDGFYYDLLRKPNGEWNRLKLRTLIGLIPMFAVFVFNDQTWKSLTKLQNHLEEFMVQRPDLVNLVSHWADKGGDEQHLFSLLRGHRMKLLLKRMLDENEFLSPYGIRSVSKIYDQKPFQYKLNGADYSVRYSPAESDSGMFGGNSNWRGPIWMPINFLLIKSLYIFHEYYSDDFKIEYPVNSGTYCTLSEIAGSLSMRVKSIFLKNEQGERPFFGGNEKFNTDEHFKDYLLFHEYFHGDTGKGLGASHQTGWTSLVALL
ncbi:MAG: Glucosidase [Sphingobacteriales bacterium]|nr:Glucosidase [Sphingobacteriales bacterium]